MKFSVRTLLIAMAVVVILLAFTWPYLVDRFTTYSVVSGGGAGGGQSAWIDSAESFRATGYPTFICSRAWSDQIPYLNGKNVPYVAVIHHEPDAEFNFRSKANIDLTMSVLTDFSFDNLAFSIEHKLIRVFHDSQNPPRVTENLIFNGDELEIENGRLLEITIENGTYSINQHKINELDIAVFGASYRSDMDRVKPVLKWWRKAKKTIRPAQVGE